MQVTLCHLKVNGIESITELKLQIVIRMVRYLFKNKLTYHLKYLKPYFKPDHIPLKLHTD